MVEISTPASTKRVERGLQELGSGSLEHHVAAGHRDAHRIGPGLDAVGDDAVMGAVQLGDAGDLDRRRAGALHLGAHLEQAVGDVDDLRLARRIVDDGGALGQRRRHQSDVRAADRDFREIDFGSLEATLGRGDDIAVLDVDGGAEALEGHQQEVDRARADGAAARQRDASLAHPREQRGDHPEAGAHLRDQLVGGRGVDDGARVEANRLAGQLGLAGSLAGDGDVETMIAEDAGEQRDVGETRHVGERQNILGEEARDHQGQRRVLGAGNGNDAVERLAACDLDPIHRHLRWGTRVGPRMTFERHPNLAG